LQQVVSTDDPALPNPGHGDSGNTSLKPDDKPKEGDSENDVSTMIKFKFRV